MAVARDNSRSPLARRLIAAVIALMATTTLVFIAASPTAAQGSVIIDDDAPAWTKSSGGLNATIHCLAEDPVNHVVYACHYRGMYRSFDGGVSWERAGEFDRPSTDPGGGLLHRHYASVAVASDGTVFVGNLQSQPGQSIQPFHTGMVRMSTDFGSTWQTITPRSTHAHRPEINEDTSIASIVVDTTHPDPARRDLVYFCSGNKLYRSNNTNHVVDPDWSSIDPNTGNPVGPQPQINWRQIVPTRVQAGNATGGLGSIENACTELLLHGGSLFMATTEGVWRSDNYSDPLPISGPPDPSTIQWTNITSGSLIETAGAAALAVDDAGRLYVGTKTPGQGTYVSTNPLSPTPSFDQVHGSNGVALTIAADGARIAAWSGSGYWLLSRASNPIAAPDVTHAFVSAGASSEDLLTLADGTMLYGTNGRGVLRSSDHGVTWASSNEGLHHFHMPVDVDDAGRVYATSGKGMAYSDDDGRTFADCGPMTTSGGLEMDNVLVDDAVALQDQSILAVTGGPGEAPGLWRSTDRCGTWIQLVRRSAGGPARHLAIAPNEDLYAVDLSQRIIRSTDSGATWTQVAPLAETGVQSLTIAPNGDVWVLAGFDSAYRSNDHGASWTEPGGLPDIVPNIPGLSYGQMFAFADDTTVYVAYQRGLYRLDAGAADFVPTGLNEPFSGLGSIARDSTGRLYVTASNITDFARMGVYTSIDDGTTWVHEPNSVNDRFRLTAWVNPQTDTAMITGSGEGPHYRVPPADVHTCFGQAVTILGTPGDDVLTGTAGNDVIHGLAGNDVINGLAGDDLICGGDGDDRLGGESSTETAEGNDRIAGEAGNDRIWGHHGDDELWGGDGDDDLFGQAGTDSLYGQAGADHLNGGWGDDVIWAGPDNDFVDGRAGNDKLYGEDGNDTLRGGSENDELWGGAGNDAVNGQGGNDIVGGNEGNDRLWGSTGVDELIGDTGNDQLRGGSGNDRLFGGAGNDRLWGEAGSDLLVGDDGADQLSGDAGNDRLWGSDGNDVLDGGVGDDVLGGQADDDELRGGDGADQIAGGPGDDLIRGGNHNDRAWGGDGSDLMYGDGGDDALAGQNGDDIIDGSIGQDWVGGGPGTDTCTGEVKRDCE